MRTLRKAALFLTLLLVTSFLGSTLTSTSAITWSGQLEELPTYESYDGYPSITQLDNGAVHVVWARDVMGHPKIFYMTSRDYGETWSDEMNLTDPYDSYNDIAPSIIQAANGTVWVVWSSNRPAPSPPPEPDFSLDAFPKDLTIPRGESDNSTIIVTSLLGFNEPVNLLVLFKPENVTTTLNPAQVTPPPYGTANSTLTVSVGTTATPGNYTIVVRGKSQKSHTVTIQLEIPESSALTQESASSRLPHGVSENDQTDNLDKIYYRTSHDGGTSWSNPVRLEPTSTGNDRSPSIIQDMNGTLWTVWSSDRAGNQELFYKNSSDGGSSWSGAHRLTTDPNPDRTPSIAQTADGRIWVAWGSQYPSNESEIFYKTYNWASWSDSTRLTNSPTIDTYPSVLQTFDGMVWVFWASCEDRTTAFADIFYKYSSDNGASWSDSIQFTTHSNEDTQPSTAQTRDLRIWVVWSANRTGSMDLFYQTSLPGDITGPTNEPDGAVDDCDLIFLCNAYGDKEGDPNWNENMIADLTGPEDPPGSRRFPSDNVVSIYDLAIVCKNYGET